MTETVVIVADTSASRVEVAADSSGAINVFNPAGGAGLDGYAVRVENPQVGDVISFNGAVFANRRQVELTDGGNF